MANMVMSSVDDAVMNSPEQLNVDNNIVRLSPDTQRYFTDSDPMDMAFYCAFGGYRKVYRLVKETHLGHEETKSVEDWIIDLNARIINESGCNYIANVVKPLVSPVAITSNMSTEILNNLWLGKVTIIRLSLLGSAHFGMKLCKGTIEDDEGKKTKCKNLYDLDERSCVICGSAQYSIYKNPYQLRTHRIADITTSLLTLYAISSNAKEGFKMKELAESFITSVIQRNGGVPEERKLGLMERIQKGFRG